MVIERIRKVIKIEISFIPVSPNVLTLSSLLVALIGVPLVWQAGLPPWLFILTSGLLDVIDGAVARGRRLTSKAGAFLDSTLDRYSDAVYLLYFWPRVDPLAIYVALIGTFMISYARCRGEALGVEVKGRGFMERGERVLYLFVASFFENLIYILINIYTVLVVMGATYRVIFVFNKAKNAT
ncbi:MAG: CDP-alcohol phosphatidyltransferase family protein [Pyrobaculum sp.]